MSLARITVIEDDAAIRRGIVDALRFSGYTPVEAENGEAGLQAALRPDTNLVLLDVLLPRMDGFTVLAHLRSARPALPVIMLTARGTEEDRVRGLRGGADDYVVKPFSARELLARVDAVLRRSPGRPAHVSSLSVAGRVVDFERREVAFADQSRAALSEMECRLLQYLASCRGRALTRDELLSRVWGVDPRGIHTRTVDMNIARLREALRDDPEAPQIVLTVRGKGYMLAASDGVSSA
ncbi:MAG: response regulator transcription factor [Phycisphaerales bacterium]|nr:response regulator transcription factor [Phycisphaerales bacterium]